LNPDITSQLLGVYFKAWKGDFSQVREKIFGWGPQFNRESAPSAGFFLAATFATLKSCSHGFWCFATMDDCVAKKCDLVLLQTLPVLLLHANLFSYNHLVYVH
jgi:hypothetical protein